MLETSRVTEATPIDAEETKELLERLSDPSFSSTGNQATVKDLAETLEMDPSVVVAGLEKLRAEKMANQPKVAEAAAPPLLFQRELAGILIFLALGIASVLFLVFGMPSKTPPPAESTAPQTQVAPTAPTNKPK